MPEGDEQSHSRNTDTLSRWGMGWQMTRKGSGGTGTSLNGRIEISPRRRKSLARKRRKDEALWRSKNGPVTITKIEGKE